ncbi:site-specific DNA-methyltransferase [Metamycoplasma hominis]|uniref:site-specific DNA-methyltransferase n=1 Tax=Metamycoplasma hominis TaxID=2098 RepID=UPI001939679F|nr:site-specific DNA-methyltransferase [Metamycoplasma hominis]
MKDLKNYIDDIDNLNSFLLNQDQKKLIKEILVNTNNSNKENLDNVFQLLIQRVKTGFVFDVAPSVDTKQIAILKKQEKLLFTNDLLNTNKNTLIIGENYDALKNLLVIERQKEQIGGGGDYNYDLIYIDPPYNTDSAKDDGNNLSEKDDVAASKFIYRDKFSRTGWLNMMNERLKMARQLLKEDGVIFVSIDDNEQAYLKVLMDEIFGEENFVCNFVWQKKNEGSAEDAKYIKILSESILMYAKNIEHMNTNNYSKNIDDGSYKLRDEYFETRGMYKLKQLDFGSLTWSEGLDYPIKYNGITYYAGGSKDNWQKRRNGQHAIKDWRWRWSNEKVQWGIENNFVVFKGNKIYTKQYQLVDNDNKPVQRTSKFSNLLYSFHGSLGTALQKEIFNLKVFDHPKPIELIKYLINIHPNPNARVLDFFAGSGTTGHAVLDLNKEDGGNRTFTLVTNNENNIGIDVCYERLYRINNGKGSKGEVDFDWIKKNEPYNQNLDVFEIKYYDTDVLANNNEIIKQDFKNMLNDFDLSNVNKINEQEILLNLTALKPVEGKDSNESN